MIISQPSKFLAGFLADDEPGDPAWFFGALEAWVPRNMHVQEHSTPCFEYHAQIQGGTRWRFGAEVLEVKAGQAILIPPGVRHHLAEFTEEQSHHFALGLLPGKFEPAMEGIRTAIWRERPRVFALTASALELIHLFVREMTQKSPFRVTAIEAVARILSIEIHRAVSEPAPAGQEVLHPAVAQAKQLIDNHPEADWPIAQLAKAVRISPRHLSSLFKKELRQTPHDYLLGKRIALACRMLKDTHQSVTGIALDCGFSSSQNFATAFRRQTGASPSGFRKQHKP
jgi:AraC-like DNA-binding protein